MGDLINGRPAEEIKRVLAWTNFGCGGLECDDCSYRDVCSHESAGRATADALALIEYLEAQQPMWISVEEALPEEWKPVNVMFDDGFRTLGSLQNMKWYVAGVLHEQYGIKYWSPLPEPPESD